MQQLTNNYGISLPMAVWLAADEYDFVPDGRSISATSLIKPVRQILLAERLDDESRVQADVADRIAARAGHAIHDSIEKAWTADYAKGMRILGWPESVIQRVRINPEDGTLGPDDIPVYLEIRGNREHRGYRISGKFDQCMDGELNDTKTTSVYKYLKSDGLDYIMQGSLYKWIHRDKITSDYICINFYFTDFQPAMAGKNGYPEKKVVTKRYPLWSIAETEAWIDERIDALEAAAELPEKHIPRCPDSELWMDETKWKYFSDAAKAKIPGSKPQKNFTDKVEAHQHLAQKGKGAVIEVPGKVKRCKYCPAFNLCSQKDEYDLA